MDSVHRTGPSRPVGSPIRTSTHQRSLTAPRGISVFAPSFFGSWHLGIPRAPFLPSPVSTADLLHNGVVTSLAPHLRTPCVRSLRRSLVPSPVRTSTFVGDSLHLTVCNTERCSYPNHVAECFIQPCGHSSHTSTVFLRRFRRNYIRYLVSKVQSEFTFTRAMLRIGSLKTKHVR
jgi:hypothetical protein